MCDNLYSKFNPKWWFINGMCKCMHAISTVDRSSLCRSVDHIQDRPPLSIKGYVSKVPVQVNP